jgi:hypothetical protein
MYYRTLYILLSNNRMRMRWAGACSTNGEKRNAYRLLVGKPEGKKAAGKTKT